MRSFMFIMIMVFAFINSFPQSLSLNETIDYLNNFSIEHPSSYKVYSGGDRANVCDFSEYYEFSINNEGFLTITSTSSLFNCTGSIQPYKDQKSNVGKLYIQDIDIEKFKDYITYASEKEVKLECQYSDHCIIQYQNVTASSIYIKTSDRYNRNKLYTALLYLFNLALEKGYVRNDINDPFKNRKEEDFPKLGSATSPTKDQSSSSSKVVLKKQGDIFILSVSINGIIDNFVLDSGAEECSISIDLEKKIIANKGISRKDYLGVGLYKLADGTIVENRRVKIPKMTVGKKTVYNVIASIGPSSSPNLLGQSFLKKLNQWSIDNSTGIFMIK